MKQSLCVLELILIVLPAVASFADQKITCSSLSAAETKVIQEFIRAKFDLPDSPRVSVKEVTEGCYLNLDVTLEPSPGQVRTIEFVLGPDHIHLYRDVFDLRVDPQVSARVEAATINKIVTSGANYLRGDLASQVQIVVYSDFACPFCAKFWTRLHFFLDSADIRTAVSFRALPLERVHPWARAASIASKCMERQGAAHFEAFASAIFERQASITSESLPEIVNEVVSTRTGLDRSAFEACRVSERADKEVTDDVRSALAAHVGGVPTVMINGRPYPGVLSVDRLRELIEKAARE